jgi:hypothetical protein
MAALWPVDAPRIEAVNSGQQKRSKTIPWKIVRIQNPVLPPE